MGLDTTNIRLGEPLRSWYRIGLRYILRNPSLNHQGRSSLNINYSSEQDWPDPWFSLAASLKPPYPHLWTYWDLSLDLGTEPSKIRVDLFRNILSALSWSDKDVAFWPVCQVSEGKLHPRPDIFWKGVELIRPCYVVCFGWVVFSSLFPSRRMQYGVFPQREYNLVLLPGPEDMLPDQRQAKQTAWKILRSLP